MALPTYEQMSPEYRSFKQVEELTKRFNKGDLDWLPNKDKEQIAMLAVQHGTKFVPKAKPVRRALFNFADTATFGLLPDKIFKPYSIGEEYHELGAGDQFASSVGTVAGIGGSLGVGLLGLKGLGRAGSWAKGKMPSWRKSGSTTAAGGGKNTLLKLNAPRDIPLLGQGAPRLGQGAPRLPGRPRLLGTGTRQAPVTQGHREAFDIYNRGML